MDVCQMELYILSKQSEKDMVAKPSKTTTTTKKSDKSIEIMLTQHIISMTTKLCGNIRTVERIFTPTQNAY